MTGSLLQGRPWPEDRDEPTHGHRERGLFLPPGCSVVVRHCGQPMEHQTSAMQWTMRRNGGGGPGPGQSQHLFACPACGGRAAVKLDVPDSVWTFQKPDGRGDASPPRRAAARRAAIAEWDRRVREQVSAAPDAHAMAIADAVVAALEELE
ncbi:hypothetical protein AB0F88_16605 [Streptosporangium sp. NPDC023963]|uniref:hypothetical protein n=1 Tax=Streptosporangium sp. NPDC023963 TaxID=3155608 RepID=UPI0034418307